MEKNINKKILLKGILFLIFLIIGVTLFFIFKELLGGVIIFGTIIATYLDKNLRGIIISFFVSLFKDISKTEKKIEESINNENSAGRDINQINIINNH